MQVTRKSILSGIERTREIEVTEEQLAAHKAGGLIQTVMPNLGPDDREFILSGITPEEWDSIFSKKGGD